jgi:hypothetical protein
VAGRSAPFVWQRKDSELHFCSEVFVKLALLILGCLSVSACSSVPAEVDNCAKDLVKTNKYLPDSRPEKKEKMLYNAQVICTENSADQIAVAKKLIDDGYYQDNPQKFSDVNFTNALSLARQYAPSKIACAKKVYASFPEPNKSNDYKRRVLMIYTECEDK